MAGSMRSTQRAPRRKPSAPLDTHLALDQHTGVLDVHVLDVLAQAEFLLNRAREIQRQILRVRGVPAPATIARRRGAATAVERIAREMAQESRAMAHALNDLRRSAQALKRAASAS
jgi:hypothetical protein